MERSDYCSAVTGRFRLLSLASSCDSQSTLCSINVLNVLSYIPYNLVAMDMWLIKERWLGPLPHRNKEFSTCRKPSCVEFAGSFQVL